MQTEAATPSAAAITAGLLNRKQLGAELRCSDRTIIRRERAGMPFIRLGALRLYDPAHIREWLMLHEQHHETPKRGRPAVKRAA